MDYKQIAVLILSLLGLFIRQSRCEKVCQGDHRGGPGTTGSVSDHTIQYVKMYSNCTIINGNLILTFIQDDEETTHDLSFLEQIEEVTGYVLIMANYVPRIPLKSLRIIRGNEGYLYEGHYYSLAVTLNYGINTKYGLEELGWTSLREISQGSVFLYQNNLLCHDDTINWDDILLGEGAEVHRGLSSGEEDFKNLCSECDASCLGNNSGLAVKDGGNTRWCWGSGDNMCQQFTHLVCSPQCEVRCYGPGPTECCHPECAGGCNGPLKTDCYACKNFYNDGECVQSCPPLQIYDSDRYELVKNPNAKFAYGNICVDECPPFLVQKHSGCVKDCGDGMIAEDSVCVECDGICPKSCEIPASSTFLTSDLLKELVNCTIIKGSIQLVQSSFADFPAQNTTGIQLEDLNILKTVRVINDHLLIHANVPNLTLTFLENLELIKGIRLDAPRTQMAVSIVGTALTSLDGLQKLKSIQQGQVVFYKNPQLCFADTINWEKLTENPVDQKITLKENAMNCASKGAVCHPECSDDGCWTTGPDSCFSCRNFEYKGRCLESCSELEGVYDSGDNLCLPCNEECKLGCWGEGADKCEECKNVKDGPFCKAECPEGKFANNRSQCEPCHENCGPDGCTGPLNTEGPGACKNCPQVLVESDKTTIVKCLPLGPVCPTGTYFYYKRTSNYGIKNLCVPCHELCGTCDGPGSLSCITCKNFSQEQVCVDQCRLDYYVGDVNNCEKCHPLCNRCTGPTDKDCINCRGFKLEIEDSTETSDKRDGENISSEENYNTTVPILNFQCVEQCPPTKRWTIDDSSSETGVLDHLCVSESRFAAVSSEGQTWWKWLVPVVVLLLMAVAVVTVVYFCWKRSKAEELKLRYTARMSGMDEEEPLTPTGAAPDMAMLRLIKESELRKGSIIGSGAFGTVYKGIWIPEGENVKIPVAIKVLTEGTSTNLNKELLEEARVMASVNNEHCIRIAAVCMTAQMMLITQLMPLGCLLDYVRKHKENIGSKVLLNWCTQIAKGMEYLESKQIVHRDLAARNVLVQAPNIVRITDFGLSKLLDYDEEAYRSAGGKLPIKWLALECIQHRIFTHKSDVWSYGVTVWELFTYGQRPYENQRARDVPDLLEKGERLPQPSICTIDVYMLMIKCWMLDADSRPGFKELAEEFAKMARDPGRYLVVQGDKLMRLPSHAYNTQDLLRQIMAADGGPENVMDAEDYLQPQNERQPQGAMAMSNSIEQPSQQTMGYLERGSYPSSSGAPEAAASFPAVENGLSGKPHRPRDNSVSSRYSADPCSQAAAPSGSMAPHLSTLEEEPKRSGPVLDEDNYLQPQASKQPTYVGILDGKSEPGASDMYLEPIPSPDVSPLKSPATDSTVTNEDLPLTDVSPVKGLAVDNPEYFSTPAPPAPIYNNINNNTTNGPVPASQATRVAPNGPVPASQATKVAPNGPVPRLCSVSSESAVSEPEYYNEVDQLMKSKSKTAKVPPDTLTQQESVV